MLIWARSSGGNSLSIWTHYIRGIKTFKGDKRALAYGAVASVKISAGMRMFELYTAMATERLTVMGGADMNVGIGGWISGAGHGPLTSVYGLGADQVLEMEVVTADGHYRIVNEKSFPNLFWAMRGVHQTHLMREDILTGLRVAARPLVSSCQSQ
jgi:FAD/FMN-containing dehydrogenase